MEISETGTIGRSSDGLSLPNQNAILMNMMYYFARYGKIRTKFNQQKKET